MVIFTVVSGLMTRQMDLVCISISMEHSMRANGKMIYNMVEVLKLGQMVQSMTETMHLEESMGWVCTNGMMAHNI